MSNLNREKSKGTQRFLSLYINLQGKTQSYVENTLHGSALAKPTQVSLGMLGIYDLPDHSFPIREHVPL